MCGQRATTMIWRSAFKRKLDATRFWGKNLSGTLSKRLAGVQTSFRENLSSEIFS